MMAWLLENDVTIIVLVILAMIVFLIVRGWIRNKGLGCDGCSSDCSTCKGECHVKPIELTEEQKERLKKLEQSS